MSIVKLFCRGSKRDTRERLIYTNLIIVFTPNFWKFSPEVIHGSQTFKVTKG